MKVYVRIIILLYIFSNFILFKIFSIGNDNDHLKCISGVILLVIYPYLVGNCILYSIQGLKFLNEIYPNSLDNISRFIISMSTGMIVITTLAIFFNYLDLFDAKIFALATIVFMTIVIFIMTRREKERNFKCSLNLSQYGDLKPIAVSLIIGMLFSFAITIISPYPLMYASDPFRHNQIAMIIINDNYFIYPKAYLPTISILVSIIDEIINAKPSTSFLIFWAFRFISYPAYALGLYLFTYQVSKNPKYSVLSSLLGTFFIVPQRLSDAFMSLYNLTPKVLIFLLFPFFLFIIFRNLEPVDRKAEVMKKHIIFLAIYQTFLFMILLNTTTIFRDTIGLILFIYLLIFLLYLRLINRKNKFPLFILFILNTSMLIIFTVLGFIGSIFLIGCILAAYAYNKYYRLFKQITLVLFVSAMLILLLQITDHPLAYGKILNSFAQTFFGAQQPISSNKLDDLLFSLYNPVIFTLTIIGVFFTLIEDHKKMWEYISLFLFLIGLLIYFSYAYYTYRILIFINPMVAYLAAKGGIKILGLLHFITNDVIKYKKMITVLSLFILTILVVCTPIDNIYPELKKNGYLSVYSPEEFDAGIWIEKNTPKNTFIISDYLGQYYFGGISGRYLYFAALAEPKKFREYLKPVFLSNSSKETYMQIKKLIKNKEFICYQHRFDRTSCEKMKFKDFKIIVVLTPGINCGVFPQYKKQYIKKFFDKKYFTLLYNNSKIYIFGINPEPSIPFEVKS